MNPLFTSSHGLQLNAENVVSEIIDFIKVDPRKNYKVIIGTDSLQLKDNAADFVTAVVVHRQGNGGRYFWRRTRGTKLFNIRDRIIQEVMLSLDVAKVILGTLQKETIETKWDFEIHADVGTKGPSNTLIQEVVGIIRANNFEAKTKPESYAASNVADRHV